MAFESALAKKEVLRFCSHYMPRTPTAIAKQLKKTIPGFYPNTPPSKLKNVVVALLSSLVNSNLLVEYTPNQAVWQRAREMVTKGSRVMGLVAPRNINLLYQTHFLCLSFDDELPVVSLPKLDPLVNFELCVLLYKFKKPKNYFWKMFNLLVCAEEKKLRDDLRIELYTLPFDYNEIELFEGVLDYGSDWVLPYFPFKPNIVEAKQFLRELAVEK